MNDTTTKSWCGLIPTTKNWVDDTPITGTYLVKNIRFVDSDGNEINDSLHATQFTWKQLMTEAAEPVLFDNEKECLLAYYRMQAFLYYDCQFELEQVSHYPDSTLANHLIDLNNLIETEQPYNYAFDLGLNDHTTDELVEFLHPETWFAVIPDSFENALNYVKDDNDRKEILHLSVYEFLLHTLPVHIFSNAHCLLKNTLTDPNMIEDLIGFDIPTDTEEHFKQFVVNNAFIMPEKFLYQEYLSAK